MVSLLRSVESHLVAGAGCRDDDDWHVRVAQQMGTNGSEYRADESTVTARAYHEKIGGDRAETVAGTAADRL